MSSKKPMSRREMKRRKRRNALILKSVLLCVLVVVLIVAIWVLTGGPDKLKKKGSGSTSESVSTSSGEQGSSSGSSSSSSSSTPSGGVVAGGKEDLMNQASMLATQYDYDGAIELLNSIEGADQDADIITMVADFETKRSNLVATPPEKVTHIFFHSLVVDPERGFSPVSYTHLDVYKRQASWSVHKDPSAGSGSVLS